MPLETKKSRPAEQRIAQVGDKITLTDGTQWRITKIERGSVFGEPITLKCRPRRLRPGELPKRMQVA